MTRTRWGLWVVLCGALLASGSLFARTGVALVHGKGGASLATPSVALNYWTPPMVAAVTKNYTVPSVVCHYDGTQYMWVAADFGLSALSAVAGLPGEDDGMVAQYSAESVGTLWFRTKANHHGAENPLSAPTPASLRRPIVHPADVP